MEKKSNRDSTYNNECTVELQWLEHRCSVARTAVSRLPRLFRTSQKEIARQTG